MTKEELIILLKEYRENKAKLRLRQKEKKMLELRLKNLDEITTSLGVAFGINSDIHSQNKISDKVSKTVEDREADINKIKDRLKILDKEINQLTDKVEEAEIRLDSLYYKEREILTAYYVDNRQAEEIGRNVFFDLYNRTCSAENIYRIIKKSTKRLLDL